MAKKIIRYIAAIFLIVAGVISLFLPLSPGLLLIFIGLYLLNIEIVNRLGEKIKTKYHEYLERRKRK